MSNQDAVAGGNKRKMSKEQKWWAVGGVGAAIVAVVVLATTGNTPSGPDEIHPGQSFTVGDFKVADGWKVTPNDAEGTKVTGTVTYNGTGVDDHLWFATVKFWKDGKEVESTELNCYNTGPGDVYMQPGASAPFVCGPTDLHRFTYDKITAEKY